MTQEQKARVSIDVLLTAAGWRVCCMADANIHASLGVADGVNVNYDVYRIKTKVSEQGAFGAEQPRALLPSGNTTILQVFNAAYL